MQSKELEEIRAELNSLKNAELAANYKKYLKSPYSFYGIRVPQLRKIAKKYKAMSVYETFNLFDELWNSGNHDEMSLALFILASHKKEFTMEFWNFLMNDSRLSKFKTWDHVDECCSHTLGEIVLTNSILQSELKKLSQSINPWIRRISMVSQAPSIKKGKIQFTILLAEKLCHDEDIYVQKATGWMLRECAKKNPQQVQEFIKIHKNMKPACFSYATEKMLPFRKFIKSLKEENKNKDITGNNNNAELDKIKYFKS